MKATLLKGKRIHDIYFKKGSSFDVKQKGALASVIILPDGREDITINEQLQFN